MYPTKHSDGKLSLLNKEKSYRQFYYSKLLNQSLSQPKQTTTESEETLSKLLLSKQSRRNTTKTNPELQEQIKTLKELKLDSPRELKNIKYPAQIKIPTVHNDYHARATNHGYSRSESGGIFPK